MKIVWIKIYNLKSGGAAYCTAVRDFLKSKFNFEEIKIEEIRPSKEDLYWIKKRKELFNKLNGV